MSLNFDFSACVGPTCNPAEVAALVGRRIEAEHGKIEYRSGDEYEGWVFRVKDVEGTGTLRCVSSGELVELDVAAAAALKSRLDEVKEEDRKDAAAALAFKARKVNEVLLAHN